MVVTLDQLRPYDHDPRVTRNPAYSEIKASIRERGLDAPPAITRRPGETHTSFAMAATRGWPSCVELWSETREERFFRIACLFRPWPARGEIRGADRASGRERAARGLTFIERALGIERRASSTSRKAGRRCRRANSRGG